MEFDPLSNKVIGLALVVHKELGPGLLESTYEKCLAHELRLNDVECIKQKILHVIYKGLVLDCGYRIDLMIDNILVVELKTV